MPHAFGAQHLCAYGTTVNMSITAATITDGIRVDQATQKGSVYDVIQMVTRANPSYSARILSRVHDPKLTSKMTKLRINGKGKETPVADADILQKIAVVCLRQSRMSHKLKRQKLREMGLPKEEIVRVYVEEETLGPIVTVFAALNPEKQFCCGQYRIDLYFATQKVAVECDEHGHSAYSLEAEVARQKFLERQLGCKFIRYDPHSASFDIYQLMANLLPLLTTKK